MHENPAPALSFRSLTKTYRVYAAPRDRLIEAFTGRKRHVEVPALHDVSGDVPRGTALGIVGQNGSGKSTLLKILAGTTAPTSGSVAANGRIASILELGAAFHPEETGRRNVILQAALYGLTQKETVSVLPDVESFAELGDFFDRPVRTYSSGMTMRLAFAAATALLPDTVILDEALAVGDGRFQKKCVDRIFGLRASGRTIVFCSHAMYYVSTLCDHAIWLRGGEVAAFGESQYVVLEYERFLAAQEARNPKGSLPEIGSETHGRFVCIGVSG
ncbi:MAG: ABC transporter ATP-binding protein, partial [Acidobacteria bacterium]|nr:ABC transporter ATP-binding protein [Acidobacteriota bacterium]